MEPYNIKRNLVKENGGQITCNTLIERLLVNLNIFFVQIDFVQQATVNIIPCLLNWKTSNGICLSNNYYLKMIMTFGTVFFQHLAYRSLTGINQNDHEQYS